RGDIEDASPPGVRAAGGHRPAGRLQLGRVARERPPFIRRRAAGASSLWEGDLALHHGPRCPREGMSSKPTPVVRSSQMGATGGLGRRFRLPGGTRGGGMVLAAGATSRRRGGRCLGGTETNASQVEE